MVFLIIAFWVVENFYTPDHYSAPEGTETPTVFPERLLPESTTGEVVHHQHFTLSYNEPYEQAEWVAYTLKRDHLSNIERERPYFIEDPKVRTKSADWRNYKGSGYDRGHLVPAGDRRFSEYAFKETFYTSNIAPQRNDFNAGIWNDLEKMVRSWCRISGTLNVITGGVLEPSLDRIGDEGVAIPDYYYKIIVLGSGDSIQVACFLLPHKNTSSSLVKHLVTIDELEKRTGIDFFPGLPDTIENRIESEVAKTTWSF
ncbi:MAG: DNA/RNA non-specific endonuclease [Eudoraea sp.]|nr:DNA/RNA non-specific endonuclease [Eudoraea sp.]MBT8211068.1 DNA/RNA non-specific endonuclease [Eudoraea sp.]